MVLQVPDGFGLLESKMPKALVAERRNIDWSEQKQLVIAKWSHIDAANV